MTNALPSPSPDTPTPRSKDSRVKITLNKSGAPFLAALADMRAREGREIPIDEAMHILLAHYEMGSPDRVEVESARMLAELVRFLKGQNQEELGELVELFRESFLDVVRNRMTPRQLREALIG